MFLEQANEELRREMADTRNKFDLLEQGEVECPLCKQPLGSDGQDHLRQEYEAKGRQSKERFQANNTEHQKLASLHQDLVSKMRQEESLLERNRQELQSNLATVNQDREQASKAQNELEPANAQLEELQQSLRSGDYVQDEQRQLSNIEAEIAGLGYDPERRNQVQTRLSEVNQQATSLDAELQQRRQEIQATELRLKRDLEESQKAKEELQPATTELEALERVISAGDFSHDPRLQLSGIEARLAELGYDPEVHEQTRDQVRLLEPFDELRRKLQESVDSLPTERETLESAGQMLERRRQEVIESQQRKGELEEAMKVLPTMEIQLEDTDARYKEIDRQKEEALVSQRVVQQQIARIGVLEEEVRQKELERRAFAEEKGIYDELAVAFGKNGIQALIIETAIPELENDANELLSRLTEGRMTLRLALKEGRRDRATGMPSEELDIRIGDEVGTRSYETFSGGEAFRINFALRIALSKLLARRSGAPLPILFIDEGFGSQDRAGQERLTEAIQSIQDDFEKIIVITHIDQIKEAFPVRIEVVKTDAGSTFEVV